MESIDNKKVSKRLSFFTRCSVMLVVCILCMYLLPLVSLASPPRSNQVVRVGFFEFGGYHETDEQNRRSGYGYEYLHEMAKYTGWVFEYVDGTWEECQEMLKNGEIDLLTSAQYSEERDELYDFSDTTMGTSYAQLTVSSGKATYGRNDFAQFSGIRIGLLKGNSRNASLAEFATEKGFTYSSSIYESQDELDYALKTGAVDAVLTSSLRKLKDEAIIAQFAPSPFYAIVKGGNTKLLQEVNLALEAIEMNSPAFRYNLYQEFYAANTTNTFVLSREEKEYLATAPTIRAVIRPGVDPISSWEDGAFEGISADIMKYLLDDLNIRVEYICPTSLVEGYEMLESGDADIACLFESDYNLAEQYGTRITTPYLKTNYSIISRRQEKQAMQENQTIAVLDGSPIEIKYVQTRYPNAKYLSAASNSDAIKAVATGTADLALVNVYSAEKEISSYENLLARFISDEEQHFSIGIAQSVDARLYSILDKKINAMDSQIFNDIISQHTKFQQAPMSLLLYFRQHPLALFLLSAVVFVSIIGVLLYIIITNKRHAKNVYSLAYVDTLTGSWNTNGFLLHGKTLLSKNTSAKFAVIAIDLLHFSGINEDYGRNIGDKVIINIGNILNRFNNDLALVAHSNADRFFMLLNYKDNDDLHTTLTAIAGMLSFYKVDDLIIRFNAYIGVGFVGQKEENLIQAIDHANIARSKCALDRAIVYMDERLQGSLLRDKEIRDHAQAALTQGEFQVYFQPKVDMAEKKIIGAEALIRWNHGKLGFLSPAEFVSILEQSGLIIEVDFFVLEQACMLIRKRLDAGQAPIVVSVNQSRVHFLKNNYLERLQNMITKYNIPPKHIELEITETLFGQEAISDIIIRKIKALGLLISIDDFGSGYSSLHLLHQISADILKIDKGLLDESDKQEKMRNIIHRIVQIAADIGVDVICEGVETTEQMEFLLDIGCKYAQGFLFSKPLPQAELEQLLQNGGYVS